MIVKENVTAPNAPMATGALLSFLSSISTAELGARSASAIRIHDEASSLATALHILLLEADGHNAFTRTVR